MSCWVLSRVDGEEEGVRMRGWFWRGVEMDGLESWSEVVFFRGRGGVDRDGGWRKEEGERERGIEG